MIDETGFCEPNLTEDSAQKSRTYPPLPEPLRDFIMRFQTECVVECCGIDAFLFRVPTAADLKWAQEHRIAQALTAEIARAEEFEAEVVKIWELNQLLPKDDWLCLLRHLLKNTES